LDAARTAPDFTTWQSVVFEAEVGEFIAKVVDEQDPAPVYRVGALARRMPWLRVVRPSRFFERGTRKRFAIEKLSQ
jgi:hypothetical protein